MTWTKCLTLFALAFPLYGFKANSVLRGEIRPSLLDNERVHKTYIHMLDNSTRPFSSLPQFKSNMGQRRLVSRIQTYQGVKVFGSRISELYFGQCRRCRVVTMGRKASLYEMSTLPHVPMERALEIAAEVKERVFTQATLMIYPTPEENHLVWMMDEDSQVDRLRVFVDARNGDIVDFYDNVAHAQDVQGSGVGILENEQSFTVSSHGDSFEMVSFNPRVETYLYNWWRGKLPGDSVTSPTTTFHDTPAAVDAQTYTQKFIKFFARALWSRQL